MQALQSSFPHLYERIHYEEVGERRIVLSMVVLLYNFRAVNVGFTQIRTVFMPDLEATAAQFRPREEDE